MATTTSKCSAKDLNNSATSTPMKPSAKQAKMQESNKVNLEEILALISSMNEKLTKLDKPDSTEARLHIIDSEISDLKYSLTYLQVTTTEIQSAQKEQDKRINQLETKVTKIEKEKERLNREIIDIRAHSMRTCS